MAVNRQREGYGRGIHAIAAGELDLLDAIDVSRRLLETFQAPDYAPPRLPAAATQLLELTRKPGVAVRQIVELLQNEQMLAAEVLRLSQSSLYGGGGNVKTLDEAIVRIGLHRASDLFLSAALNMRVFRTPGYEAQMNRLRRHSAAVAHIARLVSRQTSVFDEYAFLCGLLHDVGIAAALIAFAELGPRGSAPAFELVWPAIEGAHERSGGILARLWKLPAEVALVIEHHHHFTIGGRAHPAAAAVCVADWIASELDVGFEGSNTDMAKEAAAMLGINDATLKRLQIGASDVVARLD